MTYATTNTEGIASFETLPDVLHKVRATYGGITWVSDAILGGSETVHDF